MGHKTHPVSLRLGLHEPWRARWFAKGREIAALLEEDEAIRSLIYSRFKDVGIAEIEIERGTGPATVRIKTARPGLIIGRRGNGIDLLRSVLERAVVAVRKKHGGTPAARPGTLLRIEVEEARKPDTIAAIVAEGIARDIVRRVHPRRALKQTLVRVRQHPEVQGVKLVVSGVLSGASSISRSESQKHGKLPLGTLRAAIDYAQRTAFTPYGTIGVKVWIYKGEKFE